MSRTMSGIPTSSGGDAFLAGGETEDDPQEFTGFNNFTKDTHFDENIDADDTIKLNGSSATLNIAAISMVGGDDGGVIGGNTIGQNEAGTYGNSIYQISDPNKTLLLPAANGCVFHQTGNTDIIRTEGKAQMALAPTVGDDLCNKTYVDAAGGGGFRGFQYQQTSTSASAAYPWIFSGATNPPFVNSGNSYNPVTGFFDAAAADVGYWFFYLNITVVSTDVHIPTPAILILRSGTTTDLVRAFDNQGFQRGGANAYGTTNISSMVEVQVNDRIFAINGHNAVSSYFANQYTNFGGYKIG